MTAFSFESGGIFASLWVCRVPSWCRTEDSQQLLFFVALVHTYEGGKVISVVLRCRSFVVLADRYAIFMGERLVAPLVPPVASVGRILAAAFVVCLHRGDEMW